MGILDQITGTLFGEKQQPSVTSSPLGDLLGQFPQLRGIGDQLISGVQGVAGQTDPFTPAQIAPLSGLQQQGLSTLGQFQPQQGLFSPDFKFGQQANDAFGLSNQLLSGVSPLVNQSQQFFGQGASQISDEEFGGAFDRFNNPFIEDVLGGALGDIDRQRQQDLAFARGGAGNANAFGGTRQAVLEGDILRSSGETGARTSANLRSQSFQQAVNNALNQLNLGRGRSLAAGEGALGGAGALTGAGGTAANVGSQLFDARQGVQNIRGQQQNVRSQQQQDLFANVNALLGGGEIQRDITQQNLGREAELAGIPLQQLDVLSKLFGLFPTGGSQIGGTGSTSGLLGEAGQPSLDAILGAISGAGF